MNPVFHPDAARELEAAVAWYEERQTGLGLDFASEVDAAIRRAVSMPLAWAALDDQVRRVLVNRFPYAVLYQARPDALWVAAVMHLSREPDYWRQRRP